MYAKKLYPLLFSQKWPDSLEFLNSILNAEHPIWGAGGANREFAREILSRDRSWSWLSYRIDDFSEVVEQNMRQKIPKWKFRAQLGQGSLAHVIDDTQNVSIWLMNRYISELKNLFDSRYRLSINLKNVDYLVSNKYGVQKWK